MKQTFIVIMALLSFLGWPSRARASLIQKVAPTFWWADMKNPGINRFYCMAKIIVMQMFLSRVQILL